jgi:hypothetical protein
MNILKDLQMKNSDNGRSNHRIIAERKDNENSKTRLAYTKQFFIDYQGLENR